MEVVLTTGTVATGFVFAVTSPLFLFFPPFSLDWALYVHPFLFSLFESVPNLSYLFVSVLASSFYAVLFLNPFRLLCVYLSFVNLVMY